MREGGREGEREARMKHMVTKRGEKEEKRKENKIGKRRWRQA